MRPAPQPRGRRSALRAQWLLVDVLPGRRGPIIVGGADAADPTTLVEAFARPGGLNGALMAAFANRRDLEVLASVLA